jgi:hypothetical protein
MTKGFGTIFENPKRNKLTSDELKLLIEMMKFPDMKQRRTSREWAKLMQWEVRRTQSCLSNVHGMDVIKGGKKKKYWSEDEQKLVKYREDAPEYWIGASGQPIMNRAQHAIEMNGNITDFFRDSQWLFNLKLYPEDGREKVTSTGKLIHYGNQNMELLVNNIDSVEARSALRELQLGDKLIKITLETMDQ